MVKKHVNYCKFELNKTFVSYYFHIYRNDSNSISLTDVNGTPDRGVTSSSSTRHREFDRVESRPYTASQLKTLKNISTAAWHK